MTTREEALGEAIWRAGPVDAFQGYCPLKQRGCVQAAATMTASDTVVEQRDPQIQRPNCRAEARAVRKIRYSSSEWSTIAERARACGKPPARYVREVSLGVIPKSRSGQTDSALIRELGRIGTQLTRLRSTASTRGMPGQGASIDGVLAEILSLVRRLG